MVHRKHEPIINKLAMRFYNFYMCNFKIRYGSNWIRVERTREQHTLDLHMGIPWETVQFTTFGTNRQIFYDILEEGNYF